MDSRLFHAGLHLVATPAALDALTSNNEGSAGYLRRHFSGDWGTVGKEDWKANDQSVKDGSRILSAYELKDGTRLWIITDGVIDKCNRRYATTVLLPEDY